MFGKRLIAFTSTQVLKVRQPTLVTVGVALIVPAWIAPKQPALLASSAQFSVALFATLLTSEAVVFALLFSASSAWPSLREIDEHIAFREWVVTGSLASLLSAFGVLLGREVLATYGAYLFLLVDVFGMLSFLRLFRLASAHGRQQLLQRTLDKTLTKLSASETTTDVGQSGTSLSQRMRRDAVVTAYLGGVNESAARSDGNGIDDLVEQLAGDSTAVRQLNVGPVQPVGMGLAAVALHLEVMHKLVKASMVGTLDPVVATSAVETLVDSLVRSANRRHLAGSVSGSRHASSGDPLSSATSPSDDAAVLWVTSRYLAWLASTALSLAARDVSPSGNCRELIAVSVQARQRILRVADPDPPNVTGPHELGTPLSDPIKMLTWITGFTEFHGSHQAAGMYPVFESLTGTKFQGNYWDGASVLGGLRDALYGPVGRVNTQQAAAARAAFGSATEFDRVWTLISVGALATLRDVGTRHPAELTRPEFTSDPQLLGAYLRTFASHRYFTTAEEAMSALVTVVTRAGGHTDTWHRIQAKVSPLAWMTPVPVIDPHQRLSACVLAIAIRLAPLAAEDSSRELRRFLGNLPSSILDATFHLAARVLPELPDAQTTTNDSEDALAERMRVLQLVGAHLKESMS